MTYTPLVSIITPVLNGERYLQQCIGSVWHQDYPRIEHIFVDGGSTDRTIEILNARSSESPEHIRWVSVPHTTSPEAWVIGMKQARGDILGWLGADDCYKQGIIGVAVKYFEKNPEAKYIFGEVDVVDKNNVRVQHFFAKDFSLKETIDSVCHVYSPSSFYKREILDVVGYPDTRYKISDDLDWFIRVGKVYKMYRIPETVVDFRVHEKTVSAKASDTGKGLYESMLIARRHGASLFAPRVRVYYFMQFSRWASPVLGRIYRNRWLNPLLSWIVTKVIGEHRVASESYPAT